LGDGVAEWTKVSVATFELSQGWHFSLGSPEREAAAIPTRAWQIPSGAYLKVLPKTNTHMFKTYSTFPHSCTG